MKHPDVSGWSRTKKIIILLVVVVAFVALSVAITLLVKPLIAKISTPEGQAAFEGWVSEMGPVGFLVLLLFQILQVIIAFIPGELVQVIAGVMYGTWGGLGLCVLGCVIASAAIFAIVRKLGQPFVESIIGKDQIAKFDFLYNSEKLDTLVFVLFLIPGIPKDVLTYFVPLTKMKMSSFLILANLARIPGMIASTLIGSSITDANWTRIIALFVIVGVIGGLGIWKKDALMERVRDIGTHTRD